MAKKEETEQVPQGISREQMLLLIRRLNHMLKLHPRIVGNLLTHTVLADANEATAPYRGGLPFLDESQTSAGEYDRMLGPQVIGGGRVAVSLANLLSACVDDKFPGATVTVNYGDREQPGVRLELDRLY